MTKYFYTNGIEKFGPFTFEELKNQQLSRETKIWYYGLNSWTPLLEISELNSFVNSIPPTLPLNQEQKKNIEKLIKKEETLETRTAVDFVEKKPKKTKTTHKNWIYISIVVLVIICFIGFFIHKSQQNKLYNEISKSAYCIDGENFDVYVDKFYRDIGNYGIFPKKPTIKIIKFAKFEHISDATHIHGMSFGKGDEDLIEIYINPNTWEKFNKPMRYFLMYHELAHDVLNVDDLNLTLGNEGKLMYPALESYNEKTMDDFIESSHDFFKEISLKYKQ